MTNNGSPPGGLSPSFMGEPSLLSEWSTAVATFLGLPVPDDARVEVHDHPGFPWTDGSVIHVYSDKSGVDLDKVPHELVHVIAGLSPSRFLSEGIAVHVAELLQLSASCWPCFQLTPDLWVTEMRGRPGGVPFLGDLIEDAQTIHLRGSTPTEDAISRAWRVYVVSGSFVGWLYRTMEPAAFWEGYGLGSFWRDQRELREHESCWLRSLPGGLDSTGRQLLAASLRDAETQRPSTSVPADAPGRPLAHAPR